MTLKEMLTGSLQQLDRNTDSQTMELWRDKLTQYLNDAMIDLAGTLRPFRTDELPVTDTRLYTTALPRTCTKVLAIERDGKRLGFYYGSEAGQLCVPGIPDGNVRVTYRCLPKKLETDTDVPELPEWSHGALISYVVGRERASGDNVSVSAARACFELYNGAKRSMRKNLGEIDAYTLVNRF